MPKNGPKMLSEITQPQSKQWPGPSGRSDDCTNKIVVYLSFYGTTYCIHRKLQKTGFKPVRGLKMPEMQE